jgi:hypothetical protein
MKLQWIVSFKRKYFSRSDSYLYLIKTYVMKLHISHSHLIRHSFRSRRWMWLKSLLHCCCCCVSTATTLLFSVFVQLPCCCCYYIRTATMLLLLVYSHSYHAAAVTIFAQLPCCCCYYIRTASMVLMLLYLHEHNVPVLRQENRVQSVHIGILS